MILPALTGVSLLIMTAGTPTGDLEGPPQHLSNQQRSAAVQPFITRATECVSRTVAADPRASDAGNLGELIVDSMPACIDAMRTMIATYDQYFGDGTGEAFFSGPYLDVLPKAVSKWVMDRKQQGSLP
jgi:hypothetical protein